MYEPGGRPPRVVGDHGVGHNMGLRPDTIHGPLGQNKVTQHLGQKTVRLKTTIAAASVKI